MFFILKGLEEVNCNLGQNVTAKLQVVHEASKQLSGKKGYVCSVI